MAPAMGQKATLIHTVTEDDTALAVGSGDVPVLGTPRLIAWCEAATVAVMASHLDEGQTSVGYRIVLDHLAPTKVGSIVEVVAAIESIDGRQVTFTISVTEGETIAMTGSIVRVIVDRAKFISRLG